MRPSPHQRTLQPSAPIRWTVQTGSPSRTTATPSSWSPPDGTSWTKDGFWTPARHYVRRSPHWARVAVRRLASESFYDGRLLLEFFMVMLLIFQMQMQTSSPSEIQRRTSLLSSNSSRLKTWSNWSGWECSQMTTVRTFRDICSFLKRVHIHTCSVRA